MRALVFNGATERVGASGRWPFAVGGQRLEAYWAVFVFAHLLWMRYLSDHYERSLEQNCIIANLAPENGNFTSWV